MKKLLTMALYLLLAGLCACGHVGSPLGNTTMEETKETTANTLTTFASTGSIKTNEDDPPSYIINEYLETYYETLNDDHSFMPSYRYALYDIDGNGIKELLLGPEREGDVFLDAVYTIQDGVAVLQEEYFVLREDSPSSVLFSNGVLRVDWIGYNDGYSYIAYYRFETGELRFQTMLMDEQGNFFRSNGRNEAFKKIHINKEEFESTQQEMVGKGQMVELDWKPLAEYGR